MADTKISALPASTTPLAGTEVLPIVQSSTTKQVSVANLTAGRAISSSTSTVTSGAFVNSSTAGTISFDVSDNAVSIANLGTVNFSNFSGLIAVNNLNVGSSTLYIVGGGNVTLVSTAGVPQGTVTFNGGVNGYTWTNTSGATFIYAFCAIRLRAAA
jgi:hypothetical protein